MRDPSDIATLVRSLSRRADEEPVAPIDVRARVAANLATEVRLPVDAVPLACSGVAVAVAAAVVVALLPAWQAVSEPWIAYLP